MTEQRERLYIPDFGGGLRPFLFEPNTVATRFQISERIRKALQKWEPRINVASVDVEPDPSDPQAAIATIQYKLVATDAAERLSVSVALAS
jgi:phage baseplate assembly protein W